MILDVTCTAVPRPEIHERTFSSYTRNIKGVEWDKCTLYINIDPLPVTSRAMNLAAFETICIANRYFGDVVWRRPKKANYTEAYNWIWSNAKTELILNLEDDWELTREIDIQDVIKPFQECETLYEVVLRAYSYHYPCTCTSPAILHKRYYGAIGGKLDPSRNPETQTHSRTDFGIFIPNKKNCPGEEIKKYVQVYPEKCHDENECISKDIGREWLGNSGYDRPQNFNKRDKRFKKKCNFTKWVRK